MSFKAKNILIISIVTLFIFSCDSIPLHETDSYENLIGTWVLTDNTYSDAPWPDNKYIFTNDGYLSIYHIHNNTEYLAGKFKMESLGSTRFTSIYYEAGTCNDTYHNSDWSGNGTIMYNWYELVDASTLKLGWTNPEGSPNSSDYLAFTKQ